VSQFAVGDRVEATRDIEDGFVKLVEAGTEGTVVQASVKGCAVDFGNDDPIRCYDTELRLAKKPIDAPKTFTVYRRGDLRDTHGPKQWTGPNEPQYQGVVFADGTCVLRWVGAVGSHSVWKSFEDAMTVHGHPEPRYGTEIVWHTDES
jgi:hypothetical protein